MFNFILKMGTGKFDLSKRNKKVAISRWKKILEKDMEKIKTKEQNPQCRLLKAKLLGFLAGDGCLSIRKMTEGRTSYEISFFPDHVNLAKVYINSFRGFYEREPKIINMNNYYKVIVWNKTACLDLLNTTKCGTLNWEIPLNYLSTDLLKKEWLKAFFDCEAHVSKRQIQLQSVNEKGILQVQDLLNYFNIESKVYKYERKNKNWNINYILCIMKKEYRKNFLNQIGFNHPEKLKKLKLHFMPTTHNQVVDLPRTLN